MHRLNLCLVSFCLFAVMVVIYFITTKGARHCMCCMVRTKDMIHKKILCSKLLSGNNFAV